MTRDVRLTMTRYGKMVTHHLTEQGVSQANFDLETVECERMAKRLGVVIQLPRGMAWYSYAWESSHGITIERTLVDLKKLRKEP